MKKIFVSVLFAVLGLCIGQKAQGQEWPRTNHSVSVTPGLGLDYAFEWAFAGQWTLIGRAGLISKGMAVGQDLESFGYTATAAPGIAVEPRYYFRLNKAVENSLEDTARVPAPFLSLRVAGTPESVFLFPKVGVRRAFAKHLFHEFAAGAAFLCYPDLTIAPRLEYRIGFVF